MGVLDNLNFSGASDLVSVVAPNLSESFATLITILKAAGIAFIVYVVYLLVKAIFNLKNARRIKRIESKLEEVDKKLDVLLRAKRKSKN